MYVVNPNCQQSHDTDGAVLAALQARPELFQVTVQNRDWISVSVFWVTGDAIPSLAPKFRYVALKGSEAEAFLDGRLQD